MTAKMYQVTFSFLDPSKAVGTILAETPEEAIEKIKEDLEANSTIQNFEVLEVQELCDTGQPAEDLSDERTLN